MFRFVAPFIEGFTVTRFWPAAFGASVLVYNN
jgi:hypothetical protein